MLCSLCSLQGVTMKSMILTCILDKQTAAREEYVSWVEGRSHETSCQPPALPVGVREQLGLKDFFPATILIISE